MLLLSIFLSLFRSSLICFPSSISSKFLLVIIAHCFFNRFFSCSSVHFNLFTSLSFPYLFSFYISTNNLCHCCYMKERLISRFLTWQHWESLCLVLSYNYSYLITQRPFYKQLIIILYFNRNSMKAEQMLNGRNYLIIMHIMVVSFSLICFVSCF